MNRVRWLRAEWPESMRVLAARMKTKEFTPDSFDGFMIDRVRDTYIEARYIEKLSYQETIVDPFGLEQISERVDYRSVEFSLFGNYPQIELYDAPRSTRGFVNRLLEICDFSLAVVPITVDILDWIENFQKLSNKNVLIDSIQASGIELEKGVFAKVVLNSEHDVRNALEAVSGESEFKLDNVKMRCLSGGRSVHIYLSASGAYRVSSQYMSEFLPLVRKSLPKPKI